MKLGYIIAIIAIAAVLIFFILSYAAPGIPAWIVFIVAALNPSMFLRVSRYDIVNLQKVERFDFSVTGTLRIELVDGQETWASRRFIPAVKERLKKGA